MLEILFSKKLLILFQIQSTYILTLYILYYLTFRVVPEDERIQRYERAVVMAISGIGHTLQQLDKEYLSEVEISDIWQPFLKENRLWKLLKHNNPLVSD